MTINTDDEIFLFNRGLFDPGMDKAWTKITGFIKDEKGLYERFDETVYNTVFKVNNVKEILEDCGFGAVYFAKGTNLSDPIVNPESESKVFIIARK